LTETSFVRNATGLVRQLSAVDVFAWSIIYFPWLTSWAGVFWVTPGYYQNVNYYASLAVWSVIAMVIVLLYWQLTVVMPRSGGDYIFISRTLSSPLGFVVSFLFFVALLISAGGGSYWAFSESGTQLSFAGQVLNNPALTSLGNAITPGVSGTPWLLMAAGLVILALGAALVVLGGRAFRLVVLGFFAYGAFAMLLVLGVFLSSSHGSFVTDYGKYFPGGVAQVFTQAASKGYSAGATLANLSAVVPILFVSIGPYPVMQFVGGEIRRPRRTLLYGLVAAEVVSIAIWFGLTYLLDTIVGIPFIEAWTLGVGGGSSTVPTAFVAVMNPSTTLLWLIVVGLFIGNIGWSWLSLIFISRLFLAWSFDRVLPSSFAHVSDRFHTPSVAIFAGGLLAIIPMYLQFFTSFITAQVNAIFFYSVVWLLAAASAIVLPFAKRGVYESAIAGPRRGIPLLSVLGALGVGLFGYLGYNSVTNPAIGPFAAGAQIFTAVIVAVPALIYVASYYYNRRRGIDLRLLHAQIPPE
jgi:basic amino acid/polyamine antiporter, APA family